jgi:hypothetical protein
VTAPLRDNIRCDEPAPTSNCFRKYLTHTRNTIRAFLTGCSTTSPTVPAVS